MNITTMSELYSKQTTPLKYFLINGARDNTENFKIKVKSWFNLYNMGIFPRVSFLFGTFLFLSIKEEENHSIYLYQNSKLLAHLVCFAELGQTGL